MWRSAGSTFEALAHRPELGAGGPGGGYVVTASDRQNPLVSSDCAAGLNSLTTKFLAPYVRPLLLAQSARPRGPPALGLWGWGAGERTSRPRNRRRRFMAGSLAAYRTINAPAPETAPSQAAEQRGFLEVGSRSLGVDFGVGVRRVATGAVRAERRSRDEAGEVTTGLDPFIHAGFPGARRFRSSRWSRLGTGLLQRPDHHGLSALGVLGVWGTGISE
jgi:hypothetical protein